MNSVLKRIINLQASKEVYLISVIISNQITNEIVLRCNDPELKESVSREQLDLRNRGSLFRRFYDRVKAK